MNTLSYSDTVFNGIWELHVDLIWVMIQSIFTPVILKFSIH